MICRTRLLIVLLIVVFASGFLASCADYEATALAVNRAMAYQDKAEALIRRFEEVNALLMREDGWRKDYELEVDNLWAWSVRDRRERSYDLYQTWTTATNRMHDIHLDFKGLIPPAGYRTFQRFTEEWMEVVVARRWQATYYVGEYLLFVEEVRYAPGEVRGLGSMTVDETITALTTGTNKPPDEESIERLSEHRDRQLDAARIFDELQATESRFKKRTEQEQLNTFR